MINKIIKETFYDWAGGNVWLFHKINSLSGDAAYDNAMQTISNLFVTKTMYLPWLGALALVALFAVICHKAKKAPGLKYTAAQWFAVVALFAVAVPVNAAVNHILKEHFAYARPYVALEGSDVKYIEHRPEDDSHHSFPSGHMAFAACLVFALWEKLSQNGKTLGLLLLGLVAWSRVALGVHFPADVFWSAFVTLLVVCLVRIALYTVLTRLFRIRW